MSPDRKRVLIITYYWPPSGGSGVQRWVKFAKYLRDFGWEPVIYTPSNPEFPVIDESMGQDLPDDLEIIRQPIREPYRFYKKLVGMSDDEKLNTGIVQEDKGGSLAHRFSVWVRGNLFIPDARRFWIRPSVRFLEKYLRDSPVDAIVSNGTPHSMHLIGMKLKEKTGLPWLADFRDPWTNIDFFDDLKLTALAEQIHKNLEKKVLSKADCVTVTTPGTRRDFLDIEPSARVEVITNGFDPADFEEDQTRPDSKFVLAHIGVLTPSRYRPYLLDALKELITENADFRDDFRLRLIGPVDEKIMKGLEGRELSENTEHIPYVAHEHIIEEERKAYALLLVIRDAQNQQTIIPGKIFEYIASGRPVISAGPPGSDSALILQESGAGETFGPDQKEALKAALLRLYAAYKKGDDSVTGSEGIGQYSRVTLTEKLAGILERISN